MVTAGLVAHGVDFMARAQAVLASSPLLLCQAVSVVTWIVADANVSRLL
jgi:hypothetical protein